MANQIYQYTLNPGKTLDGAVKMVYQFLNFQHMETQFFERNGCTILQARTKNGGIKQFVGMDKAVEVRFSQQGNLMMVEMGNAKWADKAAVMAVSMFVLWPLTVTSGVGMYQQSKLMKEIRMTIEQYVQL